MKTSFGWRIIGRATASIALVACTVVVGAGRVGANVYTTSPADNKPDNFEHTFCWTSSFTSTPLRNAAANAMANLDSQTRYFDTATGCTSVTDVQWEQVGSANYFGLYECITYNAVGECDRSRVTLNNAWPMDNDIQRRKTACHELGHSVGLLHDNGLGCMISGSVSAETSTYDAHDVGHMNQSQEEPFGSVDIIQRIPNVGMRVAGWALDPDLRLGAIDVNIWIDNALVATFTNVSGTRSDVGAAYPFWGSNHGFDAIAPVGAGPNTVCVDALNEPGTPGNNVQMRCQWVG